MLVFLFGSLLLVILLFVIAVLWEFRRCAPLQERVQLTSDVTLVKDFIVSFAVVNLSPNEVLLVDAAFSPAAIEKELSRRNLSSDAVKAILLTHGHPDHFGIKLISFLCSLRLIILFSCQEELMPFHMLKSMR